MALPNPKSENYTVVAQGAGRKAGKYTCINGAQFVNTVHIHAYTCRQHAFLVYIVHVLWMQRANIWERNFPTLNHKILWKDALR